MNFGELPGVVAIGVQCPDRPAILGQSLNVLIDESPHKGVKADRVRAGRWPALGQGREQSMLGELSVLVELVGRADARNPPSNIVAVAEARNRSCTACFMSLRPQVMAEIRRGEEVLTCDNCGRILYFVAEPLQADKAATQPTVAIT